MIKSCLVQLALVVFLSLAPLSSAFGIPVDIKVTHDARLDGTGRLRINAADLTVNRAALVTNTEQRAVAVFVSFVAGAGTMNDVSMIVEASYDGGASFFRLPGELVTCTGTPITCTAAGGPLTFTWDTSAGAQNWVWLVTDLPAPYTLFTFSSATGAAGDTISVYFMGVRP